ncbi:MAG TPA: PPC domain-containing protein [Vicinamibacterales bacterium]
MKRVLFAAVGLAVLTGTAAAQTRPPVLFIATPYGMQRGTSASVIVEGANIGETSRVIFTHPGLSATIEGYEEIGPDIRERRPGETGAIIQDRAMKGKLRITVTAAPDVPIGRHGFRLLTPLGTSSFWPLWVGEEREAHETGPDGDAGPDAPMAVETPVTINGKLSEAGDVDAFRVPVRAGQELVAKVTATPLSSMLDATLQITTPDGTVLAANDDAGGARDPLVVYVPDADGEVVVRVADATGGGSWRHHYRLTIGAVPVLTSVYPLGRSTASLKPVRVEGANLPAEPIGQLVIDAKQDVKAARVRVAGLGRAPINSLTVAVGPHPDADEREDNDSIETAQPIAVPSSVNGRIDGEGGDTDHFRVTLERGQTVVAKIEARRYGSALDSLVEVLDASGEPVPRARLRAVWETTIDLRSRGSKDQGLRLLKWDELAAGDYVYVDRELIRVRDLPKGPDEDVQFMNFRGERLAFEETTPEGHALLRPVYKVEVHPPGASLPPSGLPVFDLFYANDDGGPGYGKDSKLTFTAPADGTYVIRVRDARGEAGPRHAYRLTVAPPAPGFELFVAPSSPNVPRGGSVPVTVFVWRTEGFDGPVEVELRDLPPCLRSQRGRIPPTESSVVLALSASAGCGVEPVPLRVVGRARIGGVDVAHEARAGEPVSVVAVAAPPEVRVASVTPDVIELAPGERAIVTASIERAGGFGGRVPLSVRNLPLYVTVPDIGLNGILVTEEQTSRSFEIVADERAGAVEQTLYVTARIETNGGLSEHISAPIRLRITARDESRRTTQTASAAPER